MAKPFYCALALVALSGCPSPQCPDGSAMVEGRCADSDTGTSDIDASMRTDANTDAFSVFDAFVPDAGVDAWAADAYIVPDATMCNPACGGATPICVSAGVCGECATSAQCGGATPACDTTTHTCVPCVDNATCTTAAAPACNTTTRTCVACTTMTTTACTAVAPVCNPADNTCVQCNTTTDCAGRMATPVCNTSTHLCVPCAGSETGVCTGTAPACDTDNTCTCTSMSCTSATAARCNMATNACAACMVDGDCTNVAGNPRCVSGTCRPCNVATEMADCGANSCNPVTRACARARGSVMPCNRCDADSECGMGFTCAAVNPALGNSGNYCLPIRSGICARPYVDGASETSDLGVATSYCRHATATCEAVLHHRTAQPPAGASSPRCTNDAPAGLDDAACGAASVTDGYCRTSSGGLNRCTFRCTSGSNDDCPGGYACVTDGAVPVTGARCSLDFTGL